MWDFEVPTSWHSPSWLSQHAEDERRDKNVNGLKEENRPSVLPVDAYPSENPPRLQTQALSVPPFPASGITWWTSAWEPGAADQPTHKQPSAAERCPLAASYDAELFPPFPHWVSALLSASWCLPSWAGRQIFRVPSGLRFHFCVIKFVAPMTLCSVSLCTCCNVAFTHKLRCNKLFYSGISSGC